MTPHSDVEKAVARFATALAADYAQTLKGDLTPWYEENSALCNLLITLADEASETIDPDFAHPLLQAAARANVLVEPCPEGECIVGPIEESHTRRIVQVAQHIIEQFEDPGSGFGDFGVHTTPGHFISIIASVRQREAWRRVTKPGAAPVARQGA